MNLRSKNCCKAKELVISAVGYGLWAVVCGGWWVV